MYKEQDLTSDILMFYSNFPLAIPGGAVVKYLPANAGDARDTSPIPGLGRSPGGGHGNPLQCSCLENPMDRGAWRTPVHGVAKSWTGLSDLTPTQEEFVNLVAVLQQVMWQEILYILRLPLFFD